MLVSKPTFVLVVENDDNICESISTLLEDEGYEVGIASDGREALDLVQRRGPPGVILLDLMMPGMGGAEFRSHQLADATLADVPVVLITAAAMPLADPLGADHVLLKPFHADPLLRIVEQYCAPRPTTA